MTMRLLLLLTLAACSAPPAPRESPEEIPANEQPMRPRVVDAAPPDAARGPDAGPPIATSMSALIITTESLPHGGTRVKLNKGSNDGVAPGWTAYLLDKGGQPVPGGSFVIRDVTTRTSAGESSLPIRTLNHSTLRVSLVP